MIMLICYLMRHILTIVILPKCLSHNATLLDHLSLDRLLRDGLKRMSDLVHRTHLCYALEKLMLDTVSQVSANVTKEGSTLFEDQDRYCEEALLYCHFDLHVLAKLLGKEDCFLIFTILLDYTVGYNNE